MLLLPLAWMYSALVHARNFLFDTGILPSKDFGLPVIAVGNLRVGGTGKTPMTEYLITLLQNEGSIAVVSRGYGRKSKGIFSVGREDSPEQVGDEALMIKRKHPEVDVVVAERRVKGIRHLLAAQRTPSVIILDDAMQHRWVRPGHLILLSSYSNRYTDDFLLPVGRLREPASSARRADTIVITKCPVSLTNFEKASILKSMNLKPYQEIFFAYEDHPGLIDLKRASAVDWSKANACKVLVFTGLADASTLIAMLESRFGEVVHLAFPDHHLYTALDIQKIVTAFDNMEGEKKIVLTTEKDAQRITKWMQNEKFAALPLYGIRHEMKMFPKDAGRFETKLHGFIASH